jgi:hypothetical protein
MRDGGDQQLVDAFGSARGRAEYLGRHSNMRIDLPVGIEIAGGVVIEHVVHFRNLPVVRTGRGADDNDGTSLHVRARHGIERAECTHAILQGDGCESARAPVGVRGIAGIKLVDCADGIDAVKVFQRLSEVLAVIPGDLKDVCYVELFQAC